MKATLGKKVGTGFLALMITICCIPSIAVAFAPGEDGPRKGFGPLGNQQPALDIWRSPQAIEKLKLTEVQVKQLRGLDFATREKVLPLKAQIEVAHLKMDKAISGDNADRKIVLTLAKKTADLKGKIFVLNIEARLTFKEILTDSQLDKLKLLFGPSIKHDRRSARSGFFSNPGFEKNEHRRPEAS